MKKANKFRPALVNDSDKIFGVVIVKTDNDYIAELYGNNQYQTYLRLRRCKLHPKSQQYYDSRKKIVAELVELAKAKFPGKEIFLSETLWERLVMR